MQPKQKIVAKRSLINFQSIVSKLDKAITLLFFAYSYFYFYFISNHVVIAQSQQRVFIFDRSFFLKFTDHPGGILEYLSSFITQFYFYPGLGCLIILLFLVAFFILTKLILETISGRKFLLSIYLLPSILIFGLQNSFEFTVIHQLGYLISFVLFALIVKIKNKNYWISFVLSAISAIFLYIIAAGFVWIYIGMVLIYELLFENGTKKITIPIVSLLITIATIQLSYRFLFFIAFKDLYTKLLPLSISAEIKWLTIFASILFILIPLFIKISQSERFKKFSIKQLQHESIIWFLEPVLIIGLTLLIGIYTFHQKGKVIIMSAYYVQEQEYDTAIDLATENPSTHLMVNFNTNIALSNKGLLLDKMFCYFQGFGIDGLTLSEETKPPTNILRSIWFYDMGYINEAHRFAFESLVTTGETPNNLLMLVKTNIINSHFQAAEKYLNLLDKTLFYQDTAATLRKFLNNEKLISQNDGFSEKRKFMPHNDQFADAQDRINLIFLLKNNLDNKMALENLIAWYLLKKDVTSALNLLEAYSKSGHVNMPQSMQEALIYYNYFSKEKVSQFYGLQMNTEYLDQFRNYAETMSKFNDKQEAYELIKTNFGDSYWFYFDFINIKI